MPRQPAETTARVYAYGCQAPTEGWEHVLAEADRQCIFWNRLVAIDREHDRRTHAAACAEDPEIAVIDANLAELNRRIELLIDTRRERRAEARKKIDTPELDAEIAERVAERRAERKALWTRISAWRKAHKETVTALEMQRREEVRTARQQSALYWANYNRVIGDFERARKLVRRQGRRLRFAEFSDERGILTCQIQRSKTGLGAAFGELFGGVMQVRFDPIDARAHDPSTPRGERRRLARTHVTLRVDAEGHTVRLPVNLHRAVPDTARVKSVALTWKREGERLRFQLCLTASMPEARPDHPSPNACGIDLGWRREDNGALLVATLVSHLTGPKRYYLPADWMRGMNQVERLHKHVDEETMRLCERLPTLELPDALAAPFEHWRPGLGARHVDCQALHDAVRSLNFDVPAPVLHWYKRYRHLLVWRDNLRAKLLRRRKVIYRLIAKEIASSYALIAVDALDLAEMARTRKREDGSDPELHATARAHRQRACLHELREALKDQAGKHGAVFTEVSGPSTMRCSYCGHENAPENRAERVWKCEGCKSTWDQDVNGAINILAAATSEDVEPQRGRIRMTESA